LEGGGRLVGRGAAAAEARRAARRVGEGVGGRAGAVGTAADTEGVVRMGAEAAEVEGAVAEAVLEGFLGWREWEGAPNAVKHSKDM